MNEIIHEHRLHIKESSSAVEVIDCILMYAAQIHASDIHCDPRVKDVIIRVRVDGLMVSSGLLPRRIHEEMISRLKILAGARTDVHAIPQDGRWNAKIGDRAYNIRVSFMPTYHGENVVMRLLPVEAGQVMSLSELGFSAEHVRMFEDGLRSTTGLILVTGPTGSGKTTTLHSCLSIKALEPLSVITLEDPVEYEISGVRQVHIRHSHGVTFASGLRATLRQDPDVIMVGEIRDAETARIAVHTALTGHLVLSTLHTNSALEAIPRLIDMGVDHYLLASTLKLLVGQRLVRNVCRDCIGSMCRICRGSGYKGRSVIAEVCEVDSGLRRLITSKASGPSYRKYTRTQGFKTMSEHGEEKVDWGVTTREEIIRVLSPE